MRYLTNQISKIKVCQMCQIFATLNSTVAILLHFDTARTRMAFCVYYFFSTFLSPLISLIDFFSLLTICLSLPTGVLSSSDQIPSSSLNLKHLSLSLHLKSNPKIFFLLSLLSGRAMELDGTLLPSGAELEILVWGGRG